MRIYCFAAFFASLMIFGSCKDQPEQIPAYLDIQPFAVNEPGGAGWQKITEAYLYVNREYLGAYTLPASVPVLTEGESLVYAYPGIKEDGILATPNIYPFLLRHEQTVALTPGQTTVLHPVTSYEPDAMFVWNFDRTTFDGSSSIVFQNRDTDDNSNYAISAEDAFAGKSLVMYIDSLHPTMQIASEAAALPSDNTQVWLEMNYKNDVIFEVDLLGSTGSTEITQFVNGVNKKAEWNKIYFNLTDELLTSKQANYKVLFQVTLPKDSAGKYTQNTGTVRIDNLRLVRF